MTEHRIVTEKEFEDFFGFPVKRVLAGSFTSETGRKEDGLHPGEIRFEVYPPMGESRSSKDFKQPVTIRVSKEES